jgi:hypothetical protein
MANLVGRLGAVAGKSIAPDSAAKLRRAAQYDGVDFDALVAKYADPASHDPTALDDLRYGMWHRKQGALDTEAAYELAAAKLAGAPVPNATLDEAVTSLRERKYGDWGSVMDSTEDPLVLRRQNDAASFRAMEGAFLEGEIGRLGGGDFTQRLRAKKDQVSLDSIRADNDKVRRGIDVTAPDPSGRGNSVAGALPYAAGGALAAGALAPQEAEAGIFDRGGRRMLEGWHGSPHTFPAERLVKYPDGRTEYLSGSVDQLPDVPEGAIVVQDYPLGRMRLDKVGTGEGAQAFGHGLYLADEKGTGQYYREALSPGGKVEGTEMSPGEYMQYQRHNVDPPEDRNRDGSPAFANDALQQAGGDREAAIQALQSKTWGQAGMPPEAWDWVRQKAIQRLETLPPVGPGGSLYRVEADINPDNMLQWDKPLSEQPDGVREAIAQMGVLGRQNHEMGYDDRVGYVAKPPQGGVVPLNTFDQKEAERAMRAYRDPSGIDGGSWLLELGDPEEAARRLREAGVPGIQYADEFSRAGDASTSNYVMFDDAPLNITERGAATPGALAATAGVTGAGMMMAPDEMMAQMQGGGLAAGADIVGGLLADTGQLLYSGGKSFYDGITGGDATDGFMGALSDRWAPPVTEGRRAFEGLTDSTLGAVMDYQPWLLGGETVGENAGRLARDAGAWWQNTATPAIEGVIGERGRQAVEGAGIAAGSAAAVFGIPGRSTIRGAQRKAFPGIYQDPQTLLAEAQVVPESPMLGRLFGVTRQDLADTSARAGTQPGVIPAAPAAGRGSAAAEPVMGNANTRRLVNILDAARDTPLGVGMRGWYVLDPMYQRLVELVGPDEAQRRYDKLNHYTGMMSPGSNVNTEINRGSAANMLDEQGRLEDFFKYGGAMGGRGRPEDMAGVLGHAYHKTAHSVPLRRYAESGAMQMGSPKVPLYIQAAGVPETGFQTDFAVGDAHWSRGVGLADTRTNANPGASYSIPEAMSLRDWWRDDVAGQAGLEAVPGQATLWGALAPQTGVDTPVGAPKLELWADQMNKAAGRLGISPEEARDRILLGKEHAGFATPDMLRWLALLGGGGYIASGMLGDDVEQSKAAQAFKPREIP